MPNARGWLRVNSCKQCHLSPQPYLPSPPPLTLPPPSPPLPPRKFPPDVKSPPQTTPLLITSLRVQSTKKTSADCWRNSRALALLPLATLGLNKSLPHPLGYTSSHFLCCHDDACYHGNNNSFLTILCRWNYYVEFCKHLINKPFTFTISLYFFSEEVLCIIFMHITLNFSSFMIS